MMDYPWLTFLKGLPISPWSAALYLILTLWASRKLPSTSYRRIAWMASWVDAICLLGMLALFFDSLWVSLCWLRWTESYSLTAFSHIILPLSRNIAMFIVCITLISRNWIREGYINLSREVFLLFGLHISYTILRFCLAPGKEWTNWIYAMENGYACWPYVWFLDYVVLRLITTLLWIKIWSPKNAS